MDKIHKYLYHHTDRRKKYGNPHILYQKEVTTRKGTSKFIVLDNEDREFVIIYVNAKGERKLTHGFHYEELREMAKEILKRLASIEGKLSMVAEVDFPESV